jgi:hypothetical protein
MAEVRQFIVGESIILSEGSQVWLACPAKSSMKVNTLV